ncbi:MAG: helix-turn-helix transcriptional regulator [Candidatus Rokubacteria bacterium]|nr:helix-turn-helix transcriptional regulator [Candidatus Rokubacteria bacterium]
MTEFDLSRLGRRIRLERSRRRLSLEELESRTGVSRSMVSAVERGLKAPTVLVLDRIATGLDMSIARLLRDERAERVIVLRREEQDNAEDPSGWERRILSPVLHGVEFELMRTTIPGGVDAGEFAPHAPGSREYLAMERGTLLLTIDGTPYTLRAGDSICYAGDCRHAFANPGRETCTYYLAMELGHHPAKPIRRRRGAKRVRKGARS